ncbi:hypothetical protein K450DRAFT_250601 [Umbelopsis ramanniana AG]|uniref:Uncharacterized protein n=1 Tax=Umbelopsis ramanniana AG TaxID=1314678 RepID=A0AAD5HB41_UMBRA|nr:uncharacterized protein K450DRAFT_250601 [Umbelopsis ramanniana AG]KAI8577740.1 hypothetical protein K450DRAFT_250601 [Umbelopsis ramanniana AG]
MTKTKPFPMLLKQQQSFHIVGKRSDAWSLVLRAVTDHHKVHRIGRQDSNYTLAQALLSLYDMGADIGKINSTYHIMAADLEPTASISQGSINAENWRAYIGKTEMYRGFVEFFDRELASRGVESVFEVYFPSLLDGCLGSHSVSLAHIAFGLENSLPNMISEGMAHICTTYLDTSDILSVQSTTGMKCDEVLDMIHYDQRFDGRLSLHFVNNVKLLLNSRRDLLRTYMNYMQTTPKTIAEAQAENQELVHLAILLMHTPANTTTFSQSPPRSPTNSDMTISFQSTHSVMSGSLLSSAIAVNRIIPYVNSIELVQRLLSFQRLSTICTYIIQGRTPIQSSYAEPTKTLEECKYAILRSGNIQAGITLCDLDYANSLNIIDSGCFLSTVNLLSDGEHTQRPFPKKSYSWS